MKRILALILVLAMTAVFVPAAFARDVSDEEVSVSYYGATVNATNINAGGTFNFTFGVSENSCMWSGHWLIDYPEEYVTPTAYSFTWSGSLMSQLQQAIDDDEQTSDVPSFVCALNNEDVAEPGTPIDNYYTIVGMYLTSFNYGGMQAGGNIIRVTYRLNTLPNSADICHDNNGFYMEFPIIVRESTYWVPGTQIGAPGSYHDHENIQVTNGKVYVKTMHTVNFYNYNGQIVSTQRVRHGNSATAPSLPNVVTAPNGPYVFYGWDADFSTVTDDMDVHPLYTLLGDVDFNETVDSVDALMTLRNALEITQLNARQLKAADVTFNGTITSEDALIILRYALGIVTGLI